VQKYNWARAGGENMSSANLNNQWTTVRERWNGENSSTTMPRAVVNDPNSNNRFSSRFVEEASFLRLKNLQIGYTVPTKLLEKTKVVQRFRIFFSGTNLFTVTNWKGIDPENDFNPPLRQALFGINATF
jgi:TonB-dependent starch-binding outer membrane protein SusC